MSIISITPYYAGQVRQGITRWKLICTDTLAQVTADGFLNQGNLMGYTLSPNDIIDCIYLYTGSINQSGTGTYVELIPSIAFTGGFGVITLNEVSQSGVPVSVAGDFVTFSNSSGGLADSGISPSDATKTKAVMAGSAVVIGHMALFTDTAGTVDDTAATAINNGIIQSGLAAGGIAGGFVGYPTTTSSGFLAFTPVVNATGNFNTTVSNAAAVAQTQVISIPDSGAATANFLLNTGAANVLTDYQEIVGLNDILIASVGTWTTTRIAEANYALVHTPADDTSNVSFDITPAIRIAASKGFKLNSIDVIYLIGVAALDAHTLTLDSVSYANNVAVAVTSVPLTGSLSIATQANPYVTNIAVTTPAFLVTADSKYVLELTVNAAATSTYSLYGLNLRFSQTIA